MPVELHIRLLGAFELRASDGRPLVVDSARVRSLLAYLLLHADAPISRERLASTLWPESTDPQARTNLRHVLHTLRRVVPGVDHRLRSTPSSLRWHSEPGDTLDVTEFERLARRAGRAGSTPCGPRPTAIPQTCSTTSTTSGRPPTEAGCGTS